MPITPVMIKELREQTGTGIMDCKEALTASNGVMDEAMAGPQVVRPAADFQNLVKDLAMQVAASNPLYLARDDVPAEVVTKEQEIYEEQAKASGRPPQALPKIVEGRLEKYFQEVCLLEQPFVKEPGMTVQDLIKAKIAKTGENITVKRFVRFQLGESV